MGTLQVDLRVTIRLKVAAGVLPKDAPVRMWAGYGTGQSVRCLRSLDHEQRR
jgi:hypothetical protein